MYTCSVPPVLLPRIVIAHLHKITQSISYLVRSLTARICRLISSSCSSLDTSWIIAPLILLRSLTALKWRSTKRRTHLVRISGGYEHGNHGLYWPMAESPNLFGRAGVESVVRDFSKREVGPERERTSSQIFELRSSSLLIVRLKSLRSMVLKKTRTILFGKQQMRW